MAIVDGSAAGAALRDRVRHLSFDAPSDPRPSPGDRILIVSARGPSFVRTAEFVATAQVRAQEHDGLALRHRVLAPVGHAVPLGALPSLRFSAGWTHERLGGLRGSAIGCSSRDFERAEAALLAVALEFGPRAKRPEHRRPRTPGRRALLAGRAAVGRRP